MSSPRFSRLDGLLAVLLTLVGAWVRLRAFLLVPTLTDETDEIQFALRIAQGGFFPAVSVDTYNGPLNHYLLALGLILGGGPAWPRALSLLLGALTVGLTYLLGLALADLRWPGDPIRPRLAGLLAALLLAVSFVPVVVNSHLAWSNATTPFWTTLALLALVETHRRARPALLIAAGALSGLALQTHPTAVVPILGAAAWLALSRPSWLRTRWPALAALAALLAVANLIAYNLMTSGGSAAGAAQRDYAFTSGVALPDYLANVRGFLGLAYQLVGSTFLSTLSAAAGPAALRSPIVVAYALTALTALLFTARRAGLPLACWLAALLLLPYINRAYDSHISARYMAPLLPPTFAAIGVLLAAALTLPILPRTFRPARWAASLAAAALTLVLLAYPLARLAEFYHFELQDGRNNARLWQLTSALIPLGRQGAPIVLDRGLRDLRLDAGGHIYKALDTLLDLAAVPHTNPRVEELPATPIGAYLVLTDARRDALGPVLRLEPVDLAAPPAPASPGGYWLYRVLP